MFLWFRCSTAVLNLLMDWLVILKYSSLIKAVAKESQFAGSPATRLHVPCASLFLLSFGSIWIVHTLLLLVASAGCFDQMNI